MAPTETRTLRRRRDWRFSVFFFTFGPRNMEAVNSGRETKKRNFREIEKRGWWEKLV